MIRITKKQVLMLHKQLIDEYGGSHGVRDEKFIGICVGDAFPII